MALYNLARMSTTTAGTGTITLGSAVAPYLTFAQAGVPDGARVSYSILDGSNSEVGRGVYTAAGTTLTRGPVKSTNSNAAISLSGNAIVMIDALAEDFAPSRAVVGQYPLSMDACVRIASNATDKQYGISYNGGGQGLWLKSPTRSQFEFTRMSGAGNTIDTTSCMIEGVAAQAMVASTKYFIYAKEAASFGGEVVIDHSTTGPTTGDPFGALDVLGWQFKNDGTINQRLIGFIKPDAAGFVWRAGVRGVYLCNLSSYYQRQVLNYHCKVSGSSTATAWTELNSNLFLSAAMWDDGAEPTLALAGCVACDTAGTTVYVGISIDAENPPFDYQAIYCAVAGASYPFCVVGNVGDQSTDVHVYRCLVKTGAGTTVTVSNATFALGLHQ